MHSFSLASTQAFAAVAFQVAQSKPDQKQFNKTTEARMAKQKNFDILKPHTLKWLPKLSPKALLKEDWWNGCWPVSLG